jgi:hypothetical protein
MTRAEAKEATKRSFARAAFKRAQRNAEVFKQIRVVVQRAAGEAVEEFIATRLAAAWRKHLDRDGFESAVFVAVHDAIERNLTIGQR